MSAHDDAEKLLGLLREVAVEAAMDAHMEGRIYNEGGEVRGPAEECGRIVFRAEKIAERLGSGSIAARLAQPAPVVRVPGAARKWAETIGRNPGCGCHECQAARFILSLEDHSRDPNSGAAGPA